MCKQLSDRTKVNDLWVRAVDVVFISAGRVIHETNREEYPTARSIQSEAESVVGESDTSRAEPSSSCATVPINDSMTERASPIPPTYR